ncbi:alpha/beta fold hydrolase [Salinimonas lutimaris]|uniref:alpha/beta fold hydrolase n=1 Tax=Salinimonas lutimaris TaxID=914153 RepID=UPI0010C11A9A|nr:alpha/beta hydrolase [Salinimonas lutimaris]
MAGQKITLHFAHANGFPAGSYQEIFNRLPEHWNIIAKPQFGHEPHLPVGRNWQNQVQELLDYVALNSRDAPVYLVGHSFGAVISFMAACTEPHRFSGLILIDPPLITGPGTLLLRGAKHTGYINKLTPARLAEFRKHSWEKDSDLVAYFRQKALFANMQEACIRDYVNAATALQENRIRLTFDPLVEANIFRNIPHNLNRFKNKLACPGLLITGQQSNVCKPAHWQRFIKMNPMQHTSLPGGHMLPLEHPQVVAAKLEQTISRWAQQPVNRSPVHPPAAPASHG